MKKFLSLIAILGVLGLIGASPPGEVDTSEPVPQCRDFQTQSGIPCPIGRHCYYSPCGPAGLQSAVSQRTCESPEARELGPICDLVRCDCDEPKVYDPSTDRCVEVGECPRHEHHHHEEEEEKEDVPYCRSGIGTFKIPCPKGRHCFSSSCGAGPTWSKRTCAEPKARDMGPLCDMVRCDCDEPKVYDESTDSCVDLHECPQIDPPKEEENVPYCRSGIGAFKIPCPKGRHCFSSSCGAGPTWSKRTCAEPVVRDMGPLCDMIRCDCDEPKVYDESTDSCVELHECPQIDPPPPPPPPKEEEVHYCRGFRNLAQVQPYTPVKIPCPKGMHCYSSSCGGKLTLSKRTCLEPEEREIGHICDMVRCDCDKPLVFDEVTKTCVEASACSPNQPGAEDVTPL